MHQNKGSNEKHVPVIIAGAGPTGLTMGNLLGMAGIDTLIIERNSGLSDLPKAIALDDEGLRICQAMGLLEPILQHVLLDARADYVSGKRLFARVAPTGKRNGFPLISTFQQPQFEAILLAGLQRFTCVNVAFQHNVEAFEQTEQSVIVTVRTPEGNLNKITCAYLLACDGGKSSIRRALGIPMQGSTFAQKWLVIDSINDDDPSRTITFFCNPQRPAVTIPSPLQCRRWEFMLLPGEQEADLLRPETMSKLIQQVGGTDHPQIIRQAIYTFHAVLARTFSKGRVFLLGDAAHQMPPFGGQGMNSGLGDAHNLSWKLSLVLQGLAGPSLLETYNQERREHSTQMIKLSRFAGNVVMPTSKLIAVFRDAIFLALNTIPALREYFTEMRIKPQSRYKKGFLLPGASALRPLAGLMLPQPQVTTLQGEKILLDEVLGTGFTLLCYSDKPALHPRAGLAPAPDEPDIWEQLDVRIVCVQPATGIAPESISSPSFPPDITIVRSNEISTFLRHDPDLFILVRPDRYIFGAFRHEQAAAFATTFQALLRA
ncbi:MAG TPA: bifunctional 3-(3-hydroxy-phenyl)propionate/3-hydroxycinnamic acid hydroxylase [Ktedonobacteraceae bacterium]